LRIAKGHGFFVACLVPVRARRRRTRHGSLRVPSSPGFEKLRKLTQCTTTHGIVPFKKRVAAVPTPRGCDVRRRPRQGESKLEA